MSLLTPTETITSRIAKDADALSHHIKNSIALANRIASHVIDLPIKELTEWLNSKPIAQRIDEFSSHESIAIALNSAASSIELAIGKSNGEIGRIDTRSVQEKLTENGKSLEIIDGLFVITDISEVPTITDTP
jgi:hypothetical protein